MSFQEHKITNYAVNIVDLPDKIENKAQWLKQQFDARTDNEVKKKHNSLIDALEEMNLTQAVHSADVKAIRLNADGQVEISTDGEHFETISSSGHRIIGPDGQAMPQRGKLKFTGEATLFDDVEANTTEIRAFKGEQGNPGWWWIWSRGCSVCTWTMRAVCAWSGATASRSRLCAFRTDI